MDADRRLTLRAAPTAAEPLTHRRIAIARTSSLDEKTRSIEFVLLTEDPVVDIPPDLGEAVDHVVLMSGITHEAEFPLLADHEKWSVHGVHGTFRNVRVEGDQLIGRAHFASDDVSEQLWTKVREGHLTCISAGFRPISQPVDLMPGETRVIAGRTFTARARPLRVDVSTLVRESSLVVFGADPRAVARGTDPSTEPTTTRGKPPAPPKDQTMNFNQWLQALGIDAASISDTERSALQAEFAALSDTERSDGEKQKHTTGLHEARRTLAAAARQTSPAPALSAADVQRAATEAVAAERQRVRAIEELGAGDEALADTVRTCIAQGHDVSRASQEILKKIRENRAAPGAPGVIVRDSTVSREALGLALTMRAGRDPMRGVREDQRAARAQLADAASRFNDVSLLDICRHAIQLDGKQVPHGRDDTIRSAVSGSSLSYIFSDSVNAVLLQAFEEAGDSTIGLVREAEVADFKNNDRIRGGEAGGLKRLARGGSADHNSISDSKETYKIGRYASQFVIDEQDIIDDNFGLLVDMPTQMGNAARRLRPDLVWALLLRNVAMADTNAIFHTAHANILTGGSSPLDAASLKALLQKIAVQKGVRAEVILNLAAKYLIVPPTLKHTAAALLKSTEVREGRSGTKTSDQPTYNTLKDEGLELRTEARIENTWTDPSDGAAVTGAATKFFLFGDPARCPTVEVGYRRGTGRAPSVRSFVLERGQWGVGFDVKHDIGAKAIDYRNMAYSAGA
jgi:hypothetical protein